MCERAYAAAKANADATATAIMTLPERPVFVTRRRSALARLPDPTTPDVR